MRRARGAPHVVGQRAEVAERLGEVGVDLVDGRAERAPLVAADLDPLEPPKVHGGAAHVEEVVEALEERVEPREEGRARQPPRVGRQLGRDAALVLEVGRLECGEDAQRRRDPLDRLERLEAEERGGVDVPASHVRRIHFGGEFGFGFSGFRVFG